VTDLGGSASLSRIKTLVLDGDVHVSEHGYEELKKDAILVEDVIEGIVTAVLVEGYPDRFRGPSVLTLQRDADGRQIHVCGRFQPTNGVRQFSSQPIAPIRACGAISRAENEMIRKSIKLIHEGKYAAEVEIALHYSDESWSPTMALDDARKLDAVRLALRCGDVEGAAKYGRVFELMPIAG
jgi:hypothetical protein